MADRRRQTFTAEEVARIMMEIPDDSEDSEFEGGEGDSNSDAGQQQSDFGDSDDNNIEEGVSYSDADQIESECGDSDNNNTNTETESNHVNISEHDNNVSNNGRPCRRQLAARKRPIPSVRSRSPSVRNRSNENGINVSDAEVGNFHWHTVFQNKRSLHCESRPPQPKMLLDDNDLSTL